MCVCAIGAPGCDEAETQDRQSIPDHATTPLIHGSHMAGLRGSRKNIYKKSPLTAYEEQQAEETNKNKERNDAGW